MISIEAAGLIEFRLVFWFPIIAFKVTDGMGLFGGSIYTAVKQEHLLKSEVSKFGLLGLEIFTY